MHMLHVLHANGALTKSQFFEREEKTERESLFSQANSAAKERNKLGI